MSRPSRSPSSLTGTETSPGQCLGPSEKSLLIAIKHTHCAWVCGAQDLPVPRPLSVLRKFSALGRHNHARFLGYKQQKTQPTHRHDTLNLFKFFLSTYCVQALGVCTKEPVPLAFAGRSQDRKSRQYWGSRFEAVAEPCSQEQYSCWSDGTQPIPAPRELKLEGSQVQG